MCKVELSRPCIIINSYLSLYLCLTCMVLYFMCFYRQETEPKYEGPCSIKMGLYYSYFKTLTNAPSLADGILSLVRDNTTEFGHTINTLKRFNLYPELFLASLYRMYVKVTNYMEIQTQNCWKTERGNDLPPVVSCEGMGNPIYFYVNNVFVLSGVLAAVLFLYGCLLSDSILGGVVATSAFFFNHGEATRVQWTPPLRESFGYPFCLMLMLVVTTMIKFNKSGWFWTLLVSLITTLFMISWQFAAFVLSTQVGCVFITYVLGYAHSSCLWTISRGFLIGLTSSFILLFANEMLLTSLFLSSLITLRLVLACESKIRVMGCRVLIIALQLFVFIAGTLIIKFSIGFVFRMEDDAHIFDILKSKFTNYSDFHTRLYTCAAEFDFLSLETTWKLTQTLLIPATIMALFFAIVDVLYNGMQLMILTCMAILIMRLKLFFAPHMCIFAATIAAERIVRPILGDRFSSIWHKAMCVLLIAGMAVQGVVDLRDQFSVMGEYMNPNQEQLFEWIVDHTPIKKFFGNDAVFAGTMPTMANLKLSTARAIVNHPHYEDAELRERTKKVYSIFSRNNHQEVYNTLKSMGVQYLVFEYGWCQKHERSGCSMPEIIDVEDVENRHKEPLCSRIQRGDLGPFMLAYENPSYKILRL